MSSCNFSLTFCWTWVFFFQFLISALRNRCDCEWDCLWFYCDYNWLIIMYIVDITRYQEEDWFCAPPGLIGN